MNIYWRTWCYVLKDKIHLQIFKEIYFQHYKVLIKIANIFLFLVNVLLAIFRLLIMMIFLIHYYDNWSIVSEITLDLQFWICLKVSYFLFWFHSSCLWYIQSPHILVEIWIWEWLKCLSLGSHVLLHPTSGYWIMETGVDRIILSQSSQQIIWIFAAFTIIGVVWLHVTLKKFIYISSHVGVTIN